MNDAERELAAGGFCWERQSRFDGGPLNFDGLPPDPKRARKLKAGLVKPRADERAWLAKQRGKGAAA